MLEISQKFPADSKKKLFNSQFIYRKTETMNLAKKEKQLKFQTFPIWLKTTLTIIMCKKAITGEENQHVRMKKD